MKTKTLAACLLMLCLMILSCTEDGTTPYSNIQPTPDGDSNDPADDDDDDITEDGDEPTDDDDDDITEDGDEPTDDDDDDITEDGDEPGCTPDTYRCREDDLERCEQDGEWAFYRDCAQDGLQCVEDACLPLDEDGDSDEPDEDGDEDGDITDGDEPDEDGDEDGDIEAEEEWEIDPDDVVLGGSCPEHGLSACYHQIYTYCSPDLVWTYGVNCAYDGNECWNGQCIDPDNTPEYPGCEHREARCVGNIYQYCDQEHQWITGVDCSSDGNICYINECIHD